MKTRILINLFLLQFSVIFGLNQQKTTKIIRTNKNIINEVIDSTSYFKNSSCWAYKANLYEYVTQGFRTATVYGSTQGDTIINNHRYLKFYLETGSPNSNKITAIRQENKKIYAMFFDQAQEFLLYDFNVEKGDTIYSTAPSGYISRLPIVSSIDSIQLYNGEYRKRIIIQGYETWIEGIGSLNGFDFPIRDFVTCDCNSSFFLISFAREKVLFFYNSELCATFDCCQGIKDDVKNTKVEEKMFDIFPNPTQEIVTIKFSSIIRETNFKLFNLQGKIVMDKQINETNNSVRLNQLPNGIYFYRISAEGKSLQTGKLSKE